MTSERHTTIAKRAYGLWELEGRPTGKDLEHWLRAEAEFETPQDPKAGSSPAPRQPAAKRAQRSPAKASAN